MANASDDPIPPYLRDAFGNALLRYDDWAFGPPEEPRVLVDHQLYTISAVCDFVATYRHRLPDGIYAKLDSQLHADNLDLKGELATDPSFSTGSRCLLKLIEDRREDHRRRAELRRNP